VRSRLYAGELRHRRTDRRAYAFTYGVFYCCIDLDELDDIDRQIRLFSYNRRNALSLLDRDHIGAPGEGIRDSVYAHLERAGVDLTDASVALLTNARIVGYVFNPVSFYLVRGGDGSLRHVVAEVHNTHGERHVYDLPRRCAKGNTYRSSVDKAFYVSPFIDMDARYEFAFDVIDGRFDIRINEFRGDELFFQAQLRVAPSPFTNANVARMLVRYPLMTLKTIGLIHWQGLKLWLRGEPYRRNPSKAQANADGNP
jgi:DUF1365 family protein